MSRKEGKEGKILLKTVFAVLFFLLVLYIVAKAPSIAVAWVCGVLVATIYVFVFEIVAIDVAAICVMVFLGLTLWIFPFMGLTEPLVDKGALFSGFSSNAVISIVAVMIIGAGLDMTGVMGVVAKYIMRLGGRNESRIITVVSSTVGVISSFMQNVGAAALFLPVIGRISARTGIAMSRLLMPMGFCAILGGTMTLVGSSPLIMLNDLIDTSNSGLPADKQMAHFDLFSVTPIGAMMIVTGIIYFVILGRFVLPKSKQLKTDASMSANYYKKTYGLEYEVAEVVIPLSSQLVGVRLEDFETKYQVRTVAINSKGVFHSGGGYLTLDHIVEGLDVLAVVGDKERIDKFIDSFSLQREKQLRRFSDYINPAQAGLAEAVVHPSSPLVGKSARDLKLRSEFGASTLAIIRGEDVISVGQDVRSMEFSAGDTLVLFTAWKDLQAIENERDMVIVTSNYPHEVTRPNKVGAALSCLIIALSMVLFTDLPLSVSLLVGAMGMVLSKVISIEEAYQAVSWKTVFLLASLIPLGLAVENSGTAKWVADITLSLLEDVPAWGVQLAVAVLATFFTLVMSNVGATVLLVPLAVNIAIGVGADPSMFALTVALATSNSFLIPTHQVNALIMGPGGYRVVDFLKAGGIMTILFLVVLMFGMRLIF